MKLSPLDQQRDDHARELFRPGLYRHYKGDTYAAVGLVRHHDTRRTYVLYSSLKTGATNVRPLVKLQGLMCPGGDDQDCWNDRVEVGTSTESEPIPRFRYIGPLP